MKSPKIISGRELWVMANFLKTSIYDSCMSHTYVIYIFSESEFCGKFYENKIFRIRPRKIFDIFEIWFSPKCVGENFFGFQIRKKRKNSHQMISIDIRFTVHTPTQNDLSIFEGLSRLRMMEVFFQGLKLRPSCSEGSITLKKSEIKCI